MYDCYCSDCGEYTTQRGAFGEVICGECWEAQDRAVEASERRTANRFGYDQAYYQRLGAAEALARAKSKA
ncbi:MAG: hypothetical protein HQ445_02585 [Polaromonas sp.]|nr:hypothetical protein [Polaromonas sp.]